MEASGSSIVCSADVAAFVDALETINYNEAECYDPSENVVICISEPDNLESASITVGEEKDSEELSVTDIEDSVAAAESGSHYFNPDTRKLKAVMQRLVAQKKAVVVKKTLSGSKGSKQFKSDVWNWFGDVRLFISEGDAERLKIPYYIRYTEQESSEAVMICKVFVGCFRCNALFMYDAQKHSTSTLRYHVRACNRPKECIFVSEDKMDDELQETPSPEKNSQAADGSAPRTKRFRTDPRKQKEVIEQLFQKQRAVVTRKSFMNMKGNRRFKSDVWNWFGDIKLLISRSEAKQLKIPYYIRRCGDEQMVLSKVFVGCFKCMALFIHDSQKSTSTLRYHIRTCSRPKERKKRTTPNIIFFPDKRSPKQPGAFTDSDAIQAHEKLLNFALSTESSLDVIQDSEFHKMLQLCITIGAIYGDVNVDSLLCATPTLTSFILNDLYVSSINAFYTEFQHAYGATYKPMVWIDEQMKNPFLSVHCSYADSEGQLKSVVLHTDDFDYDNKTPVHLKEWWFARFLSDQPVIPFKRIICIDNDSNMVPAFKDEMVVKCVVQNLTTALQLVATKGTTTNGELPDFTALLGNCIDIVDYFESISEHCEVPQDLVKCADDKWTSILALFASVDAQYDNILNVLNDTGATHLLSAEKATVSGVVEFLRTFEEAVVQLSSTTEPTLNLVIPWVTKLQKKLSSDRGDSVALKQLKSNIIVEFNERVVKNLCTLHQMATLLDPRFKKLSFGSTTDHRDACTKVKSLVKECMEEKGPPEGYEACKCQKAAEEEVDKYLASSFSIEQGSKFSTLGFWQDHVETYPNLCRIAQWLLTCPASSNMGCETFSSNNWVVHCPRLPIEHDNVNKVLFVKSFKGL